MLSSCDVYWKRKFPNLLRVTRVGGQKSAITYMIERKLQNYSYEHQKMESKENIENYYTHTHTHNQSKNEANGIGQLREAETVTSSHGHRILCKLKPAHKRKRLGLHSWKGKAGTMTRREKTGRARRCTHDDEYGRNGPFLELSEHGFLRGGSVAMRRGHRVWPGNQSAEKSQSKIQLNYSVGREIRTLRAKWRRASGCLWLGSGLKKLNIRFDFWFRISSPDRIYLV